MAVRWRRERGLAALFGAMMAVSVGMGVLCLILWLSPAGNLGWITAAGGVLWLGAALVLWWVWHRPPTLRQLALRVDPLLGGGDRLLALSEWPQAKERWRALALQQLADRLKALDLANQWALSLPLSTRWAAGAALVLTAVLIIAGGVQWQREERRIAHQQSVLEERLALAEEVLEDWEEFASLTEDEELKTFFAEAGRLREKLAEHDPLQAMVAIGQMEEQLKAMAAQVEGASIAPHAAAMAGALEAFEGMGALGAALRRNDFQAASREAARGAEALDGAPKAQTAIRRHAITSETLAATARQAAEKGQKGLADALSAMAQKAKASDKLENRSLSPSLRALRNEFSQEAARRNRGRMAAIGRDQLNTLRQRLQGGQPGECPFLSLAQTNAAGQQAGRASGGNPFGDEKEIAPAGRTEQASVGMGEEGDSEITTLSDTQGSGVASGEGGAVALGDYVELSRRAVNDESLPLAHRRAIRTYFERIRPVVEPSSP